jgi:hypothetical protein
MSSIDNLLLRLPVELQLQIYEYVFVETDPITITQGWPEPPLFSLGIPNLDAAIGIYYSQNVFVYHHSRSKSFNVGNRGLLKTVQAIDSWKLAMVKDIRILDYTYPQADVRGIEKLLREKHGLEIGKGVIKVISASDAWFHVFAGSMD